jgi:hypothetical protein
MWSGVNVEVGEWRSFRGLRREAKARLNVTEKPAAPVKFKMEMRALSAIWVPISLGGHIGESPSSLFSMIWIALGTDRSERPLTLGLVCTGVTYLEACWYFRWRVAVWWGGIAGRGLASAYAQ